MRAEGVYSVIKMRWLNTFFQCRFARSIWSIIQVASDLYPPISVANISRNWLHGIDLRFRAFVRVGALAVIWSLWLCRNDKVLNDKNCSLLQVIYRYSVCDHLFSGWRIETYLWRSVHDWRLRRGILFPNMCDRIIYRLVPYLLLRQFTITRYDMYFAFFCFAWDLWTAVCILAM
jgi:hypothetical protein